MFKDLCLNSQQKIQDLLATENATLSGCVGAGLPMVIQDIAKQWCGLVLVVVAEPVLALRLERELTFMRSGSDPVSLFPDWETLPFDPFTPHRDLISDRLRTLHDLPNMTGGIVLVSAMSTMNRLCPKSYIGQSVLNVRIGQRLELSAFERVLMEAGYRRVNQVMEHGEYALRGSIVDLFPSGSVCPLRIDLLDNEIDSIRIFDVDNQLSVEKRHEIRLLPAREFPMTEEGIRVFRNAYREEFEGNPNDSVIYREVSDGVFPAGMEYYLPLFFEETHSLYEYLPSNTLLLEVGGVQETVDNYWSEIQKRYEQFRYDRQRPILEPKKVFYEPRVLAVQKEHFKTVKLMRTESIEGVSLPLQSVANGRALAHCEKDWTVLTDFVQHFSGKILFCAESSGRKEALKERLNQVGLFPVEVPTWQAFIDTPCPLGITVSPLEEGVVLEHTLAILTETELFNRKVMQRRRRTERAPSIHAQLDYLGQLAIGDLIVHRDYGIGCYRGLQKMINSGVEGEFICLQYAAGDKIYVPASSIQVLSRYGEGGTKQVELSRLGSDQWQKAKKKALLQIQDVASDLLGIYSKRFLQTRKPYPLSDKEYQDFVDRFPFEETIDQQKAIDDVMQDLHSDKPMDRVICGDVGFGKTEVALRAAFKVVQQGKQVAILVPTTLLAEQHYQTSLDRFSDFPVRISQISRFKTTAEQGRTLRDVSEGKIDILIGTHKLLSPEVKFKDLGLLIIDEEHRFGVKQKEKFKMLRSEVDILTLTATPIPRTLNLGMIGLRDISIIASAPEKRLSIKTFVRRREKGIIIEAITRELHRGGQIYFLHNEVKTIQREADFLQQCIPQAKIAVAHGQMRERDLERVMSDFYHRQYNVLVCTTIIETGIDIPTANTIIIDRADTFGLAQLHQLRGRVGRSHHQAYAYCLLPEDRKITIDAERRLEAIEHMDELGIGFGLATQDLEIRGSGEILGESQSGQMHSIGFSLYMELLERTVEALKEGQPLNIDQTLKPEVEVNLKLPAFIPETYIQDIHTRLVLYGQISQCKTQDALDMFKIELIDRFGLVPRPTIDLIEIAKLRLLAKNMGIQKVDASESAGQFFFSQTPRLNAERIINLIKEQPKTYLLEGSKRFRFNLDLSNPGTRIEVISQLLVSLQGS